MSETPSARTLAQILAPDGVLRVNVNLAVELTEFATWPPETVRAFMIGVAQVLSAQAYAEESRK